MKRRKQAEVTKRRKGGDRSASHEPQDANLEKSTAARRAQAQAEDAADAAWLAACRKIERRVSLENPRSAWYEALAIAHKEFPPQPQGFHERRVRCNRCGDALELNPDYDAQFCRRCNRWTEHKCPDPKCQICRKRPSRPR